MTTHRQSSRWLAAALLFTVLFITAIALGYYGPFRERPTPPIEGYMAPAEKGPRVRFLLAPQHDKASRQQQVTSIARSLGKKLTIRTSVTTAKTTVEAVEHVTSNKVEVAILPALACSQAKELNHDVRFIAVEAIGGSNVAHSLLVVRQADSITQLSQLRQKRICFVDTSSDSGFLMTHLWLRSRGFDPTTFFDDRLISGSHTQALQKLSHRECDVAAVDQIAFDVFTRDANSTDNLVIFAQTGVIPRNCWVASARLDERLAYAIGQTLTTIELEDLFHDTLEDPFRITQLKPADTSTFRAVRVAAQLEGLLKLPEQNH